MRDRTPDLVGTRDARAATLLVTGASGFIGSHLSEALPVDGPEGGPIRLDIRPSDRMCGDRHLLADIRDLRSVEAAIRRVPAAIHLAALAEAAVPFFQLPELATVNVAGTAQVLQTAAPKHFVFASSSAVYGSRDCRPVDPEWRHTHPVGAYGASKAFAELVCRDWASSTGGTVVILRLGNVVGPGCRGLIPFLVRHALRHPSGDIAAECRGGGAVIRDYVPVSYVVGAMIAALNLPLESGVVATFNVGTGRPLANRDVAVVVQRVLRQQGYDLRVSWDHPLLPGEATAVVLNVDKTVQTLGLPLPVPEATVAAIEEATRSWLRAYEEADGVVPDACVR
jgi:nucleoside-diphosphate-sugar epimerase